jgi:hypothetical protein
MRTRRSFTNRPAHPLVLTAAAAACLLGSGVAAAARPGGEGARTAAAFTPEQRAFWAFQPVKPRQPPPVKAGARIASPIDRFVLAALQEKGLTLAAPADRHALLRRATFDLTGLPPAPDEIAAFLRDDSPGAFARVVDRLLASPHYGERWGRHWLDVARYADTTANDANAVMRFAWRYRDYVIGAFNRDLPYDRFVVEQLAGDLLPPSADAREQARRVIATGFLMVGPKALAETDKEQTRMDIVDEQLDATGRAFLGLTLSCARCHDHKFDPIPTADYYALAGIFRGTDPLQDENRNATMWQELPMVLEPGGKPELVMAPKEGQPVTLRVHVRGSRFRLGASVPRRFPQILAGDDQRPLTTAGSGRLELARWIADPHNPLTARVMVNRIWQHHFGTGLVATADNFGSRGERPSHPELLDWLAARFVEGGWSVKAMHRLIMLSAAYQQSAAWDGRAARVDPDDRLLWRMPRRRLEAEALRDALLAAAGSLDRRAGGPEAADALWKKAEVLDAKRGFAPNRMQTNDPYYDTPRRSVYLPVVRNALPDVLALFDAADPNAVSAVRNDTTVPAQALFLLNNPLVRSQALRLAQSLLADAKADDGGRVGSAHLRALGRPATDDQVHEALAYLDSYAATAQATGQSGHDARLAAWQSYCQALFCSNEFLYID